VADDLRPDLVGLSAVSDERLRDANVELRALAKRHRVAVGGAGATGEAAEQIGAVALTGDVIAEAGRVTALAQSARS
jgi:methanogenic corrinoid protein MtbC1